jgi:uncharacterized protein (UPF0333 family)
VGKFFGQRGQASAPFELFVAVTIMAFVIVIGYQTLEQINREVCLSTVEREMTNFKINLEDTVARKSQNKIFFSPDPKCFSSKNTVMKIEIEKSKSVCASRCSYPSDTCYVMTFQNPNIANAFKQKCLDLPKYTSFVSDASDNGLCSDVELSKDNYHAINPMEAGTIMIGSYIFRNISPAGETFPKVCVFYRP